MKITRFQAFHRAKPRWRFTVSLFHFIVRHFFLRSVMIKGPIILSLFLTLTNSYAHSLTCILFNISPVTRLNSLGDRELDSEFTILIGSYYSNCNIYSAWLHRIASACSLENTYSYVQTHKRFHNTAMTGLCAQPLVSVSDSRTSRDEHARPIDFPLSELTSITRSLHFSRSFILLFRCYFDVCCFS